MSKVPLKTAVCISGRLDGIESFENIRLNILEPYQADVFLDAWIPYINNTQVVGYHRTEEHINLGLPVPQETADINIYAEKYQPRMMCLDNFDALPLTHQIRHALPENKTAYNGNVSHGTKTENVFFMWYKIWKANQLRKLYEQANRIRYDRIIRMRFDSTFNNFPVIEPVRKTIYIPKGGDYLGGICDQFALGDSLSMDIYCELYNELYRYTTMGMGIHPESILRKHLEINRVDIARFDCEFALRGQKQ